ncbi:MAG TPA: choice-of-anchor A family protein [Pseudobdellovibrionaceae bacterium]|nr:choice-of-anchor A family protein [Pseudobdellovibrionaceae bacterium]
MSLSLRSLRLFNNATEHFKAAAIGILTVTSTLSLSALVAEPSSARTPSTTYFQGCQLQPEFTQVFARGGIEASSSDYNGFTLAGRGVSFANFLIAQPQQRSALPASMRNCPALTVAGPVGLHSGRIEGIMGADSIAASRAHTGLRSSRDRRSFDALTRFEVWSADTSKKLSEASRSPVRVQQNQLFIDRRHGYADGGYYTDTTQLAQVRVLKIIGHAGQKTVITVYGNDAVLENMAFELEGGLRPQDVLLNFPMASSLRMARAGSGSFGIPASILAPYAAADLRDLAITGQVFVGSLCGNGQINEGLFAHWPQAQSPSLPPAPHPCEARPQACAAK